VLLSASLVKALVWISKPLNSHLKKRGIKVFYWVLNDQEYWQYAIDLGADGVITDCPSELSSFLEKTNN